VFDLNGPASSTSSCQSRSTVIYSWYLFLVGIARPYGRSRLSDVLAMLSSKVLSIDNWQATIRFSVLPEENLVDIIVYSILRPSRTTFIFLSRFTEIPEKAFLMVLGVIYHVRWVIYAGYDLVPVFGALTMPLRFQSGCSTFRLEFIAGSTRIIRILAANMILHRHVCNLLEEI